MRSTASAFLAVVLAAPAAWAQAAGGGSTPSEEPVSGSITMRDVAIEILPEPPPPGETIQVPEGWWRIESGEAEPGATGSYSVVKAMPPAPPASAAAPAPAPPPAAAAPAAPTPAPAAAQPAPPPSAEFVGSVVEQERCFREKEAYAHELFRIAGIWYFDRPLELIEGLQETPGIALSPWVRFNLFGLAAGGPLVSAVGVDPVRPVGWDEGLRWAAEDLIDCIRTGASNAPAPRFEH